MPDPFLDHAGQRFVGTALVLAAGDQRDFFEALQRFLYAAHVGGLAVLVIAHAPYLAYEFHAMVQRLEAEHGFEGFVGAAAQKQRAGHGRHDVFLVVHSLQPDRRCWEAFLVAVVAVGDHPVPVEDALFQFHCPAEGEYPCRQFPGLLPDQLVIAVQHREVVFGLILENAQLGVDVIPVARIAIQMILAQVQQRRHGRAERVDPFQLERADLGHHLIDDLM